LFFFKDHFVKGAILMATATSKRSSDKSRPVHEVRLGRIKAAIWENDTQTGIRHNVTITRIYKDGNEWKTSDSFGRDDLPLVAKVSDMAHSWIFEQSQNDSD
jgi:hypothetical protein